MTTKMYKAFVKSKETGELTIIESEYTSKKDFARDLRTNGYAVKFISTPEKFDEDCENYHWELKRRKNVREAMKQHKASKEHDEQEVQEAVEQTETVEGISKMETTTETDDSGFTYYSVKVAYEAMDDKKRSIVFMNYSEALEVAEHFTETWGGDKAIVIAVNFAIRNDRQPESERDKRVLEDETAEIERRCVPYNYLGLRGYVSIEDKQIVNEDIA